MAAWRSPKWSSRLPLAGVWCHYLDETWYHRLHDPADYTRPLPDKSQRDE